MAEAGLEEAGMRRKRGPEDRWRKPKPFGKRPFRPHGDRTDRPPGACSGQAEWPSTRSASTGRPPGKSSDWSPARGTSRSGVARLASSGRRARAGASRRDDRSSGAVQPRPEATAEQLRSFARAISDSCQQIPSIARVQIGRRVEIDGGYARSFGEKTYNTPRSSSSARLRRSSSISITLCTACWAACSGRCVSRQWSSRSSLSTARAIGWSIFWC